MAGDHVEITGEVVDIQKGKFIVEDENGNRVLTRLSGKMNQNKIRIVLGDTVKVKVSAYDLTHGFIVSRL